MVASGPMPRSTDEWLMSRSCHRATFSIAGVTAERTRRARPVRFSRVMLALTHAGISREAAYAAVQENAMKVWRGEGAFLDFLKADERVTLPHDQLEALFDLGYHTKNVDVVFKRVFGD